jgi:hypothetical protein
MFSPHFTAFKKYIKKPLPGKPRRGAKHYKVMLAQSSAGRGKTPLSFKKTCCLWTALLFYPTY